MRRKGGRTTRRIFAEPCHWICLECGYLVPQRFGSYRHAAEADEPPPAPCAGCGARCWADLRHEAVCEGLGERDEDQRRARVGPRSRTARALRWFEAAAVVGGVYALWLHPVAALWPWVLVSALGVHLGWGVVAARRSLPPARHPARWRLAVPRGRARRAVRAMAQAYDPSQVLTAPLSGRRCLGYEVAIRDHDDSGAAAADWLLLEQRAVDLGLDGRRIDADAVRMDVVRTPLRVTDNRLGDFLRRRGLTGSARGLTIYETILRPGDPIELREHTRGGVTLRSQHQPRPQAQPSQRALGVA